ncbi:MAG: dethiobiotin synthase [Bacteroidota bacterium]|jgi:dethiobiotin synthetase
MSVIIAGIHTGIGKTICSAVICQALGYDYWKPVQAGDLDNTDTLFVQNMVTNPACHTHPETHRLRLAASPHYAAAQEGINIKATDFTLPATVNPLVVETAGGIMSPLAPNLLNIHLAQQLQLPVILVSNNYLGSINHTLLTVAAMRQHNLTLKGLVFSGQLLQSTRDYIVQHTGLPILFSIPQLEVVTAAAIAAVANTTRINF